MVRFKKGKPLISFIIFYLILQCHGNLQNLMRRAETRFWLNFNLVTSKFQNKENPETTSEIRPTPVGNGNFKQKENEKKELIPKLEDVAKNFGYPIDSFEVTTEDGYILTLFRIKHGKNGPDKNVRKPVMLQHGILDSSAVFLATKTTMAYYLADNGYDVWIGNSRGTMLSRRHLDPNKDPDKKGTTYWDFSFHEMGVKDLPAVLKMIRKVRQDEVKIHFIGMSMGSTQFLVMGSELPEYLEWIDCVILMAPVAKPSNMDLASGINYFVSWTIFNTLRAFSKGELSLYKENMARAIHTFCTSQGIEQNICKKIMENLEKPKRGKGLYDFENTVDVYLYSPGSTSIKSFVHYLQIVSSGEFRKFDLGKKMNKIEYKNQKIPPKYNLKNIKKKIYIMMGGEDKIAAKQDVKWLQDQLISSELVSDKFEKFTHRDFHHSKDIETNLYSTILQILKEWESKKDHSE